MTVNVASPISSVIPSLDGPVLDALATTTAAMTLSQVHRRSGQGSLAGVRRVLLRLVEVGVVLQVPGGYAANREHLTWPAIELLSRLHGSLLDRLTEWIADRPEPVTLAGLFGSAARRDGDEHSDIDLVVVSEADSIEDLVDSLAERVTAWTGNPVHIVSIKPADIRRLRHHREPILAEWTRDLVLFHGDRSLLDVEA